MDNSKRCKGFMKKMMAVIIGMTMAFSAFALPAGVVEEGFTSAHAYTVENKGTKFNFTIETDRNVDKAVINAVYTHGETVEFPSTVTRNGVEYPVVKVDSGILKNDETVKTVIFPDTVKYIGLSVLSGSSVENIELPDGLEHLDTAFAANCPNLRSVKYNGTSISGEELGGNIFKNSNTEALYNEKGALCLGNWLLDYKSDGSASSIKISELGNEGVKLDSLAAFSLCNNNSVESIDLEGIRYIGIGNFGNYLKLNTVINDDDVETVCRNTFIETPWYEKAMGGDLVKLGKVILYYKTDSDVIDLTSGRLKGTKCLCEGSLADCQNAETIFCDSDCYFEKNSLYTAHEQNGPGESKYDPLPLISTYKIKDVYLDGKKLTYKLLLEDPAAYKWLHTNFYSIEGAEFLKTMVEQKTKDLFKQMDITYYGMNNDKTGSLTSEEEFYIRLKIHNYLSIYEYDDHNYYMGSVGAFLMGGKVNCQGYADIAHYLLECAGLETKSLHWDVLDTNPGLTSRHVWNSTKIGDEWFESDDGWDAQGHHEYVWFGLSSALLGEKDQSHHKYCFAYDSFHSYPNAEDRTERVIAERTLGDADNDGDRDEDDAEMLWVYVKLPETFNRDLIQINKKNADINFDGVLDVTDAVLLENFMLEGAIDEDNVPIDGLAPTVKVAFLNGQNYNKIQYLFTDREGYITLPDDLFEAPEGKKLSYDIGKVGQKVRITRPLTVVNVKWIDENEPDSSMPESSYSDSSKPDSSSIPDSSSSDSSKADADKIKLGDVNADRTVDIEDAVMIINHVNGVRALTDDESLRADIDGNKDIDIEDAVAVISHVNGIKALF